MFELGWTFVHNGYMPTFQCSNQIPPIIIFHCIWFNAEVHDNMEVNALKLMFYLDFNQVLPLP